MTSSTLPIPTTTSEAVSTTQCDVCPHPLADHDPIAARFCSATGSAAIARGCVCRS
jgi:hypothetical protein